MALSDRLYSSIASILSRNLIHAFPNHHEEPPEHLVRRWEPDIQAYVRERGGRRDDVSFLEGVWREAKQKWRDAPPPETASRPAASNNAVQFSLFHRGAGNYLDSIVTVERILDAPPQDRLALMQTVEHMGDILPDWEIISPLLLEGLRGTQWSDYLSLCVTWFNLAGSDERMIHSSICEHIVTVLEDPSLQRSKEDLRTLILAFYNMWMDWMLRDSTYRPDVADDTVGLRVLRWGVNPDALQHYCTLHSIIASIDPFARWFRSWIFYSSTRDVLQLISGIGDLLPSLCKSQGQVRQYSLSITYGILETTRVSHFPWEQMGPTRAAAIEQLLGLYVSMYCATTDESREARRLCEDGMETILWGCKSEAAMFTTMLRTVQAMESKSPRLERMLQRIS